MHANLVRKDNTWWTVKLQDFRIGSTSVISTMHYAIVDTGTSLLYLIPQDYSAFKA